MKWKLMEFVVDWRSSSRGLRNQKRRKVIFLCFWVEERGGGVFLSLGWLWAAAAARQQAKKETSPPQHTTIQTNKLINSNEKQKLKKNGIVNEESNGILLCLRLSGSWVCWGLWGGAHLPRSHSIPNKSKDFFSISAPLLSLNHK